MADPTWETFIKQGWMVIDRPSLRLAAYATKGDFVGIAFQQPKDRGMQIACLDLGEVEQLQSRLEAASQMVRESLEAKREQAACQLAYETLERVKGGTK